MTDLITQISTHEYKLDYEHLDDSGLWLEAGPLTLHITPYFANPLVPPDSPDRGEVVSLILTPFVTGFEHIDAQTLPDTLIGRELLTGNLHIPLRHYRDLDIRLRNHVLDLIAGTRKP